MKKSRSKKASCKSKSIEPIQYRDPVTGIYAFPTSFGASFAEQIRKRFAKNNEVRP